MSGGSLRQIVLPYPDFQLNEIIDPYEHNSNNSEMIIKINEMVTVLNSFINGEANTSLSAMAVSMPGVEPIEGSDLETFLRNLIGLLRATTQDESGAHFVKSAKIEGIAGESIWEQLANVASQVTGLDPNTGEPVPGANNLSALVNQLRVDLNNHKTSGDHDVRYFTKTDMDNLIKGRKVYDPDTGQLVDTPTGSNKAYLPQDGNLLGTWEGWTVEQMRSQTGTGFGTIEVLDADPVNPAVGRIWIISGQGEDD